MEKLYAFWKDFDLEKEKLDILEKRKKLKESQEKTMKRQKIWGVGSADQGATSDESSLLLDYKAEIDRANEAEKAFIELSDKICEAVDPFPILSIWKDENKRIKWDFSEAKALKGFQVPDDASKEKEPRFLRDYIVEKCLGQGGFGLVFKCQKRIDKQKYAVKKISIRDAEKEESILSEVYALSRMQHRNVIRYYDAWIEPYGDDPVVKDLKRESSKSIATSNSSVDGDDPVVKDLKCESSKSIATSNSSVDGDDPVVKDLKCESSKSIATSNSSVESSRSIATPKSIVNPNSNALYIQMQLCTGSLYNKILSKITKVAALKYMRQITEGLHYLHQNEVVHGDLSSMNVLVDDWEGESHAIIADFGLAVIPNLPNWDEEGSDWTSTEGGDWISEGSDQEDGNQEESEGSDQEESAQEGGNQVVGGNLLYLAPERRNSKGIPVAPSSPKSDIYSLGVIFVELFAGFLTDSPKFDRVRWIDKAKSDAESGKLSDEIPMDDHPLLLKMLSSDPQARPSTREVLEQLEVRRA